MFTFLTAAVLCGTFVWFVRKAGPALASMADRVVCAIEVKAEASKPNPPLPDEAPMPQHLIAEVSRISEPWAREDALKRLRELYELTKDWDRVTPLFSAEIR